jgi:hypothetical protein
VLNRNYSYTIHFYNALRGGNAVESLVGSILTIQCRVKQRFYGILKKNTFYGICARQIEILKGHVVTEEKIYDIRFRLEASPKKSLRLLTLQCWLAECAVHIGTKVLKLRPYKAAVVHSLLPPDCEVRMRYCKWFQESIFKGLFDPELTFYSDEAW